ncbi:UvrD-helicase domain-containing protein [Anaerobaca lacustris]|uniref:DNA 3'-5' helicase n=1 Tax=Anaerobaca lacustris TaxID=3044600 RepID=A0AAW6TUT2_9BACT|nr:UvrD-helicase domain-containing protein [Sedimentisphaerales bacterium M17dextr]
MIALDDFIWTVRSAVPRFQQHPPNRRQEVCVLAPPDTPLMIVAGPGSGKTTVLVLRALRLVFVDGLMPEHVVITTFTRKAADEIRSRLIEWGLGLVEYLRGTPPSPMPNGFLRWLDTIDINRFITGTLDSICEDALTTLRDPGDAPPVLVEGFVGNALLAREGMFPAGSYDRTAQAISQELAAYLAPFTRDGQGPANFGEAISVCRTVVDRLIQDRVDIAAFARGVPCTQGRQIVVDSLRTYRAYMAQTNRMDFAGLEEVFFDRLRQRRLQRFTSTIRAVLVDEYQDTNPLQEAIYFELLRETQASFTVVGDDDQSLYRFRGATVELFCHLPTRLSTAVPQIPRVKTEHLVDNYRSTPEIVTFFNDYITYDPAFLQARVQPPKPRIMAQVRSNHLPILGLFRQDAQTLAADLATFLYDVFRANGRTLATMAQPVQIVRNPHEGDIGDAVLLAHTVSEFGSRFGDNPPRERLPLLLRRELSARGISVFNPRGRALRDIPEVQVLLGLLLLCIDPPKEAAPEGAQQTSARLRRDARHYLSVWRHSALDFISTDPAPNTPRTLEGFVAGWQERVNQTSADADWPDEWPILELCYKLVTWLPFFQDDPEGQVYLEALSRCIAQAATFSSYRSKILHGQGVHDEKSVLRAILDIMVPLAENSIEVDEEIMPHVPRDRLPIMTIHQAKGLEFPLVIVDVSSDYMVNHPKQRFRRYPEAAGSVQLLENDLGPYSSIGGLRTARADLARTSDDLIRLYYVAYSRPQSLLILVGIDRCLRYASTIRHVATAWRADGTWAWQNPVTGSRPVMVNNCPLELV